LSTPPKSRVEENDTFKTVAKEWIAKNERENMTEIALFWLLDKADPKIGNRPIAKITVGGADRPEIGRDDRAL
jgi:hypothetical protein